MPQVVVAEQRAPHLRPAEEEALVAGEAVDDGRRLAVQRQLVGAGSATVSPPRSPMFSPRVSLPFTVISSIGLERVVLLDQHAGALLEGLLVLGRPPVAQVAVAVRAAALVVEAVADLVADDAADGAVVDRLVRLGIEERRLQDGGREDDLVERRSCSRRSPSAASCPTRCGRSACPACPCCAGSRRRWRASSLPTRSPGDDLQAGSSRATCPGSRSSR